MVAKKSGSSFQSNRDIRTYSVDVLADRVIYDLILLIATFRSRNKTRKWADTYRRIPAQRVVYFELFAMDKSYAIDLFHISVKLC